MAAISYPLINGHRFDFSSLEATIAGMLFNGIKALNYKETLDPGEVRGNKAQLLGRTRGKYSAEGSLELFALEFQQLCGLLTAKGLGIYEQQFDIVANYLENPTPMMTDVLVGVRIKSADRGFAEGNEPLVIKCDLSIMYIIPNGQLPLSPRQMIR